LSGFHASKKDTYF